MWTLFALSAHAQPPPPPPAGPRLAIEPGTLRLRQSEAPHVRLDPTEPPGRCLVRIEVDPLGTPVDVEARGCGGEHAEAAEDATSRFQWAPPVDFDGVSVRAVTIVPVRFTPATRVPVEDTERCVYQLRIAANGSVSATPTRPTSQCQLWESTHVNGVIPAVSRCEVDIDRNLHRDSSGWASVAACAGDPADLEPVVEAIRGSLFSFGADETRFVVTLPDESQAPPSGAVRFQVPSEVEEVQQERLIVGGEEETEEEGMESAEDTEAPKVTLPQLPRR